MKAPARNPAIPLNRSRSRRADLLAILGLFAVVFIAHVGSLNDGLFFDDHWHRATLHRYGWSFHDLIESATFDLRPGSGLANLWWQEQPLQWRYARPVAMFFMKLELLLTGGNPVGIHVCALIWHALTATLVYLLAVRAIRHRACALIGAAMLAFHPHSVFGVSWTAARNALISGFFFAAAMHVYAAAADAGRLRVPISRLLLALGLWGLALFSRETAIILPLLLPVLDVGVGGKRLARKRLPIYLTFWLLAGAYLYWRLALFPTAGPPSIYYTPPSSATYPLWAASKLLHMVFALLFATPLFLGLSTYVGLNATQLTAHAVMLILLPAVAVWYVWASRGVRTRWLWPTWLIAAFVPVIPVFVTPHFAYLPAAALAVMVAVLLHRLRPRRQAIVAVLLIGGYLWSFGVYRYIWRGILRSEQLLYADIEANTPPPKSGGKLFFINLPIAGIYTTVALREAWQADDLEGYVLTFATHPLMMQQPCVVEPVGDHELIVSTEPPGYFSGLTGHMLRDGTRPHAPLHVGTIVKGDLFDTSVLAGNERGITRLKFAFHRPLSSPDYYFYVSSPQRPACQLDFRHPAQGIDDAHARLFTKARSADGEVRVRARAQIATLAQPLAIQTASPLQAELHYPELMSDEALDRVEDWWRATRTSERLEEYARWYGSSAPMLRERNRYFCIVSFARRIIRSDLLLTGKRTE